MSVNVPQLAFERIELLLNLIKDSYKRMATNRNSSYRAFANSQNK